MNSRRILEKKSMDFDLNSKIEDYKKSKSNNIDDMIKFIDKLKTELNNEYAVAVSAVNIFDRENILNVFDVSSIIESRRFGGLLILQNRITSFKEDHKESLCYDDNNLLYNVYSVMLQTLVESYRTLREITRSIIEENTSDNTEI